LKKKEEIMKKVVRDFILLMDFFSTDEELKEAGPQYVSEVHVSDDDDEEDEMDIDVLASGNCGC